MGDVSFDFHQLDLLAADLGAQPAEVAKFLPKAIEVTARNVKDAWNAKLYREGHARLTGGSIDYTIGVGVVGGLFGVSATTISAEIGARRGQGRQAGVVLLLEYGSIHNPPHGAGTAALQENEADFHKGIAAAVDDALKARKL